MSSCTSLNKLPAVLCWSEISPLISISLKDRIAWLMLVAFVLLTVPIRSTGWEWMRMCRLMLWLPALISTLRTSTSPTMALTAVWLRTRLERPMMTISSMCMVGISIKKYYLTHKWLDTKRLFKGSLRPRTLALNCSLVI